MALDVGPSLGAVDFLVMAFACAGFFVARALTTSYLMADAAAPPGLCFAVSGAAALVCARSARSPRPGADAGTGAAGGARPEVPDGARLPG